jgi:hypothetical protein
VEKGRGGMIGKIKIRLSKSQNTGLFHDSRSDVREISKVCNLLIDKVNELTDKINQMEFSHEQEK